MSGKGLLMTHCKFCNLKPGQRGIIRANPDSACLACGYSQAHVLHTIYEGIFEKFGEQKLHIFTILNEFVCPQFVFLLIARHIIMWYNFDMTNGKRTTTLSGISQQQVLRLKQIALRILGVNSVSALVRAIADGDLIVIRRGDKTDEL